MHKTDRQEIQDLAELSHESGCIPLAELDEFLRHEEAYDARLDRLIDAVRDVPLQSEPRQWQAPLPVTERDCWRSGLADAHSLGPYLRDLARIKRMERDDEMRLAKRFEFARKRFHRLITQSRLSKEQLRTIVPEQLCSSYVEGVAIPADGNVPGSRTAAERERLLRGCCSELGAIRAEFVERNLHLVVNIVLPYRTYGVPVIDLIQEGSAALIRAVEKFDWRKNVRFQTYATFWIRQAAERSIAFSRGIVRVPNYLQQKMRRLRREGRLSRNSSDVSVLEMSDAFEVKPEVASHLLETGRTHFSLDAAVEPDGESFAALLTDEKSAPAEPSRLEETLLRKRLDEVLRTLSPQERRILELRFGLGGASPLTLEKVGKRMKVSRERIRQLQVCAIRKLRKPGLIDKLEGFI
ncbi:MAG: sigma-70 family RNA polymerase sigma factor [Planctomycetota bacterium]